MKITAVVDIVCAVFIGLMYLRSFSSRNLSKSNRLLYLCLMLMIFTLLVDAGAYTFVGNKYPLALRYFLNMLSFTGPCLNLLAFTYYTEAFIGENTKTGPWFFRGLKVFEYIFMLCTIYEYISGHLISYDINGLENYNYAYPQYIEIMNMIIMISLPVYIWIYRRKIGEKMALLMILFGIVPILTAVLYNAAGVDFAYSLSAVCLVLVAEFVQKKHSQKIKTEQEEQLQKALEDATNETKRNDIIADIIGGAKWTYKLNADDEVIAADYSEVSKERLGVNHLGKMEWLQLVHPDDREHVSDAFYACARNHSGNTPYNVTFRILGPYGNYRWMRSGGNVIRHDDGSGEFFGISIDITEQMEDKAKHEEQLALSDGLAREYHTVWLVDGFGEHLMHLYRSTGRKTVKKAVQLGLDVSSYDSAIAKYVLSSVHEDDRERVLLATRFDTVVRETPDAGTYVVSYKRYYDDEGHTDYHQMCFAKAVSADGTVNYILAYRDADKAIRDQMAQQQKLREALETADRESRRNDMLLSIYNAGKWSYGVSADDEVISASYSEETQKTAGVSYSGNPMGWTRLIHPDDRDRTVNAFMAAVRDHSGRTLYDETFRLMRGDGTCEWTKSAGRVIRREDGNGEFFGMNIDITEQIEEQERQQKQLESALKMAEVANTAKTNFLFNMSHDIRTPMNAIIGFTNMAKKEISNPEKALDCLDKVKLSSDILLNLINDVLDMSRIESGKVELHEKKYEIIDAFDSFEPTMASLAASKDIDLEFKIGEIRDRYIFTDGPRFDRVLINIISNAIKYTQPEGYVRVSVEQIEDTKPGYGNYKFTVADSGIGMSEEFQKHMFEDFTREENSTTSGIQGTGLGLSLAKKLVDMMGGTISCVSKQGIGTTFSIVFPFRLQTEEDIEEKAEDVQEYVKINLDGKRVLLAEDNELNREIAEEILSDEGITVETAIDGQQAVKKVLEHGPGYYDFVLMDIQMPVMDGYEATREIKRMMPDIKTPIIALSANAFEEDRKKSLEAGMDAHVAKPIKVSELMTVLSKFI